MNVSFSPKEGLRVNGQSAKTGHKLIAGALVMLIGLSLQALWIKGLIALIWAPFVFLLVPTTAWVLALVQKLITGQFPNWVDPNETGEFEVSVCSKPQATTEKPAE